MQAATLPQVLRIMIPIVLKAPKLIYDEIGEKREEGPHPGATRAAM